MIDWELYIDCELSVGISMNIVLKSNNESWWSI